VLIRRVSGNFDNFTILTVDWKPLAYHHHPALQYNVHSHNALPYGFDEMFQYLTVLCRSFTWIGWLWLLQTDLKSGQHRDIDRMCMRQQFFRDLFRCLVEVYDWSFKAPFLYVAGSDILSVRYSVWSVGLDWVTTGKFVIRLQTLTCSEAAVIWNKCNTFSLHYDQW
jgi:hypothetical protein